MNIEPSNIEPSRLDYVKYDTHAENMQLQFKAICKELERMIGFLKHGRPKAIALTKLEEMYMWIGKSIRDEQIERNGCFELQEERKNG